MNTAHLIKIAKALADPTRFGIFESIRAAGEVTCSGVCSSFHVNQATISHHVKILADAGLISVRKQGQFHHLSANHGTIADFVAAVAAPSRPARSAAKPPQRPRADQPAKPAARRSPPKKKPAPRRR